MLNAVIANVYMYDSWLNGVVDNLSNNPLVIAGAIAGGIGLLGAILCRKWLRAVFLVVLFAAVCLIAYAC